MKNYNKAFIFLFFVSAMFPSWGLSQTWDVKISSKDWKLIINSDNEDNIDPFAFFNLKDNPYEVESKYLLKDPEQKERITDMYDYYVKLRSTKERTTELLKFLKESFYKLINEKLLWKDKKLSVFQDGTLLLLWELPLRLLQLYRGT